LPSSSNNNTSNTSFNPLQVCDDALKVLEGIPSPPSSPQRQAYQKELLLDNLTFLHEELDASSRDRTDSNYGDDFEDDLLLEGDIEDDDHDCDEEEASSLSSRLPVSFFVEYQLPLVDKSSTCDGNKKSSMDVTSASSAQISEFQRELLLDRCMDDLQQTIDEQQRSQIEVDISLGDIESDIEEDLEEEQEEDDVAVLGEIDFVIAHRIMGWSSVPSSE
jgi:hypothetical protein